jgi:hypothetical protein
MEKCLASRNENKEELMQTINCLPMAGIFPFEEGIISPDMIGYTIFLRRFSLKKQI